MTNVIFLCALKILSFGTRVALWNRYLVTLLLTFEMRIRSRLIEQKSLRVKFQNLSKWMNKSLEGLAIKGVASRTSVLSPKDAGY